jgi:hypothetical protein
MRIAILQPSYLPWLGYLDQIKQTDAFVFYDDVQFDKNGWRNRNRIRIASESGWQWLTIPVQLDEARQPINSVRIDGRVPWGAKHLRTLGAAYAKRKPATMLERYFAPVFASASDSLADTAIASTQALCAAFGLKTTFWRSSELGVAGERNERLVNICRRLGATEYLSGVAAQSYLDESLFRAAGISVHWQQFEHPSYTQCFEPFVSHLSAIDALLNCGDDAKSLLPERA